MQQEIKEFNEKLSSEDKEICVRLAAIIDKELKEADARIWHSHPVWFIEENPIVGYSRQKAGIRLMFWSGADFQEDILNVPGKKFKDASVFFNSINEIRVEALTRCLKKSKEIQWDYKNIVKRKGQLQRLK